MISLLVVGIYAVIVTLALVTAAVYLNQRDRLEGDPDMRPSRERVAAARAEAMGAESATAVNAYLGRLRTELHMPLGIADEVVQEIADHIEDTRVALIAEGLESPAAVREALARLGASRELALGLRQVHQSRKRLLAGAAGGVLAFPGAVFGGLVPAALAYLPMIWIAQNVPAMNGPIANVLKGPIVWAVVRVVAFFFASRTAVRICASVSRRTPGSIGWAWALIGTPLVAADVMFGTRGYESWMLVVAEMLVPVAFAAGAIFRVNSSRVGLLPALDRWDFLIPIVGFGVAAGMLAGLAMPAAARDLVPDHPPFSRAVVNLDVAAPLVPQALLPAPIKIDEHGMALYCEFTDGNQFSLNGEFRCFLRPAGLNGSYETEAMNAAIAADKTWTDYRIEVWQGTGVTWSRSPDASGGIYAGASAATMIIPVQKDGALPYANLITTTFRVPARRDGPAWWVLVTAQGPDGHRYRLTDGTGLTVLFEGTPWDWLTADG